MSERLRLVSRYGCMLLVFAAGCAEPARVARRPPPAPPAQTGSICERSAHAPRGVQDAEVNASFRAFARSWVEKLRAADADGPTRRQIPDELELELRPTGNQMAPYVGILRYCDQTLRCASAAIASCAYAKSTAVTEIFRFQDGVWVY